MESLVNYESDDESGDYNDFGKCNTQSQQRIEEDANYDEIGMDESSEESNNNNAESHFSAAREKQGSSKGDHYKDSSGNESSQEESNFQRDFNRKLEEESSQNGFSKEGLREDENCFNAESFKNKNDDNSSRNEELYRRHSSDMDMDDGEDDLDNYKPGDSKCVETTLDFRQKFSPKNINFTKGKNLGEESVKNYEGSQQLSSQTNFNDRNFAGSWNARVSESEKNMHCEENESARDDKTRKEKGKDSEDRRREESFRKDEKDYRKRDDDRWRDSDRDRKREGEKYKDDRDRRRSPDRREHKKRSHSPEKRDRDREYDRNRDKDRSRDRERSRERTRERDRDRDREKDRDRDRDRERDRDRDREYRTADRRSPKHPKRSSGSPERSWKARKLEKKAAVLNKLGIELKADVTGNLTPRQLLGEQLKAQIQEVEAKTGVTLPTYYNPGVMNPLKYAQQIQKRKLLWGNKNNESKGNESTSQGSSVPSAVKQWEAATFKGDNDGKMTEKFKRLMGIKGDTSTGSLSSSGSKPPETKEIIQKQEEMFSNMEAQYQVARMATHTHRGVGLGFGTFQVPPR